MTCGAAGAGEFSVQADALWVKIGQHIRNQHKEELWYSVAVAGTRENDGTLNVRILVFNPDWEEPLQIASIRSQPQDRDTLTALGCNLDHVIP